MRLRDGVLYSAGIIAEHLGQPTIAADLLVESGYANEDCSDLDKEDRDNLRFIKDNRVKLGGLD